MQNQKTTGNVSSLNQTRDIYEKDNIIKGQSDRQI